jgi:hypothetical protein
MRMFDNLRRGRRKSIAPASFRSEQQRHIREHLSEEELTLFDILLKPAPELSEAERRKVKAVARELLEQVKALLVLNWRAKAASRGQLKHGDRGCARPGPSQGVHPGAVSAEVQRDL